MNRSQAGDRSSRAPRAQDAALKNNVRSKLVFTYSIVTLALIALCVVLCVIVHKNGDDYSRQVFANRLGGDTELPFRRGEITDRSGTVLAESVPRYRVIIDPSNLLLYNSRDLETTLQALVSIFGCDREKLDSVVERYADYHYARTGREVTQEEMERFEAYRDEFNENAKKLQKETGKSQPRIQSVTFEVFYQRNYIYGSFAADVLGYSRSDSAVGECGLERYYNDYLAGENGRGMTYIDEEGTSVRSVIDPVDGCRLVTTIDFTMQSAAESCIEDFLRKYNADNVGIVAVNPNNGEVLTMAMDRQVNLNDPGNPERILTSEELKTLTDEQIGERVAQIQSNFAVEVSFEPGSTAKPLTVAAAIEEASEDASSVFNCDGGEGFGVGGSETYIRCSGGPHDEVDLAHSLIFSCNDALMQIGKKLGAASIAKYISLFGFGRQTGIDLPYENAGSVHSKEDIGQVTLATNSFGQNYNVNMIQMAMALSSAVNGGIYYQPHLMKEIVRPDGTVAARFAPVVMHKTMTQDTSAYLRRVLRKVVTEGTGKAAAIDGYDIGGKTGTAEKMPREDRKYLVSFVGFAPVDSPQLLVYVVADNPSLKDGSELNVSASIAVELEKSFMEKVLPYLGIPQTAAVSGSAG